MAHAPRSHDSSPLLRALAEHIERSGWPDGLPCFINQGSADPVETIFRIDEYYQSALSLMVERKPGARVLVADANLGATAGVFARVASEVVSVQPSRGYVRAVEIRVTAQGLGNVEVTSLESLREMRDSRSRFDIVWVHDLRGFLRESDTETSIEELLEILVAMWSRDGAFLVSGTCGIAKGDVWRVGRMLGTRGRLLLFDFYTGLAAPQIIRSIFNGTIRGNSPVRMLKYLLKSKNYGIIVSGGPDAVAPAGLAGIMSRIRENTRDASGGKTPGAVYVGSRGVLRIDTEEEIIRFPRTPVGLRSCRTNREALLAMKNGPIGDLVPAARGYAEDPVPYFAEERMKGRALPYEEMSRDLLIDSTERSLDVLETLQGATRHVPLDESAFDETFGWGTRLILETAGAEEVGPLRKQFDALQAKVSGLSLRTGVMHGDFKVTNFIVDSRKSIVGVIDWDQYRENAPLFVDCCFLLGFNLHLTSRMTWISSILALAGDAVWGKYLARYMDRKGSPPELANIYLILAVFHFYRGMNPILMKMDYWRRENVSPVIAFIRETTSVL